MVNKIELAKKWYASLGFPAEYDDAFAALTAKYPTLPDHDIAEQRFGDDKPLNLLLALSACEALQAWYAERGIPEQIMRDTLLDIVIWTKVNTAQTGVLGLGEANWIRNALLGRLFRLGRLQFRMEVHGHDTPPLKEGERVLGVHIPRGGPLAPGECDRSFIAAREFFARYFPDYAGATFTCHSWLLDDTLAQVMREDANILQFGRRFCILRKEEGYDVLRYAVDWSAKPDNLSRFKPANAFAERVIRYVSDGGKFYSALGYIKE